MLPEPRPTPQPVLSAPKQVQSAIARAAASTGVDFTYLLAQARLESGLDPSARARTSSATGLYQFTGSTWLKTLDRHGAAFGIDADLGHDPAQRAQLLALRQDPQLSALMAGELANDTRAYLAGALGRDPDNSELYLAHFLGPDAAGRFLAALAADPGQSASALLPRAAAANHAIFYAGGTPRSVGQVMDLLRARLDSAMQDVGDGPSAIDGSGLPLAASFAANLAPNPAPARGGPLAQEFAATAAAAGPVSMAETLNATFGLNGGDADGGTATAVPAGVRAAYGRMRALGF